MTDQTLWAETPCKHGDVGPHGLGINARIAGRIDCPGGDRHEASPADLVAALVKAVEEGTIEGAAEVDYCAEHLETAWNQDECWKQVYGEDDHFVPHDSPCHIVFAVVVPVREEPNR